MMATQQPPAESVGRGTRSVEGDAARPATRDPRLQPLFAGIDTLPGVGPKVAARLARLLGTENPRVLDLLFHLPRARIVPEPPDGDPERAIGRTLALGVEVLRHTPGRGRAPSRVAAASELGPVDLVFFNARAEWLERRFPAGARLVLVGRLQRFRDRLQMVHPERIDGARLGHGGLPVYPLSADLPSGLLRRLVGEALARLPDLPEWLDPAGLPGPRPPTFADALHALHLGAADPTDPASPARLRLALDELFANQLALALVRRERGQRGGRPVRGTGELTGRLLAALPFAPTDAQLRAFAEIREDLARPAPMMRLLLGDVGSGKTLVALLAMLTAAEAGLQSVLLAPTEVLARQHAATLGRLCAPLGLPVGLLTGREGAKERGRVLGALAEGSLLLCAGTHALFQAEVRYRNLGLAVVDEQHRFGVGQRLALVAKGGGVDLLLMSATPIPRSLLLSWYGDIATSRLDGKPAGRNPVVTRVASLARLGEVVEAVGRALARGERGYWVCPAVAATDASDIAAAQARFAALRARFGDAVGLVHGGLGTREKAAAMDAFARGRTRLLVATTVIEVGVDVPEATLVVIEQAERFGLAQLHQLRGRIGRGGRPGTCLLLYRPPISATARARLALLRECDDGFRIAEEDLRLRGPGEVLGVQQSGMPRFRFADLAVHAPLLPVAAGQAERILRDDPELAGPRGRAARLLLDLFGRSEARALLRAG